jgi:hypothetical protein
MISAWDRRAVFFLGAAVACVALLWPCPAELRWVGEVMTVAFLVLSGASWLDHSHHHGAPDQAPHG